MVGFEIRRRVDRDHDEIVGSKTRGSTTLSEFERRRSGAASLLLAIVAATSCDSASVDDRGRDAGAKSHREAGRVATETGGAAAAGTSGDASAQGGGPSGAGGHPDGGPDTSRDHRGADAGDTGPIPDGASCAEVVRNGELVPLDMYILLDRSSSMLDTTAAGGTKWQAISSAVESFASAATSNGVGIGLQYFPLLKPGVPAICKTHADCGANGPCFVTSCDNTSTVVPCTADAECGSGGHCIPFGVCQFQASGGSPLFCAPIGSTCTGGLGDCIDLPDPWCINGTECTAGAYSTPAVPIALLPANGPKIMASIDATTPGGRTPTAPALEGALREASSWAKANPGHRVVAVLATDGVPNECTPIESGAVAALATQGLASTPSIPTFVIGVVEPTDTAGLASLDAIAGAGGTQKTIVVDTSGDVPKQFQAALDSIRGSAQASCDYQVPPNTGGAVLDLNTVTLEVTSSDGKQKQLAHVADGAACATAADSAWYYDAPPTSGATPTRVSLCPSACSAIVADGGAVVHFRIACKG